MNLRFSHLISAFLLGFQALVCLADSAVWEWENMATVEVLGTLRGQGTLVLINDQPRILTNSHVTQGKSSAVLDLPWREEFPLLRDLTKPASEQGYSAHFKAQLEFESPIADVAVLAPAPDTDPKVIERLKMYAAGRLCSPGFFSCKEGFERLPNQTVRPGTVIYTTHQGNREITETLAPFESIALPDLYVSGQMGSVLKVPAFAIPGMSGGGLYQNGTFSGMVTKIELGGAGEAYAIPVKEISRVIAPDYFKGRDLLNLPKSHWEHDASGYRLVVESNGHQISMPFSAGKLKAVGGDTGNGGGDTGNGGGDTGNGGGDTGNGGGDTGNGGGDTGNGGGDTGNGGGDTGNGGGDTGNGGGSRSASLWNLDIRDYLGKHDAIVVNPFAHPKSLPFTIDGKPVAYFKVKDPNSGKMIYLNPTAAHYLWLQKNAKNEYETVLSDEAAKKDLEKARANQRQPLYARLYRKRSPNTFELLTDVQALHSLRAGAQSLSPCTQDSLPSDQLTGALQGLMDPLMDRFLPLHAKNSSSSFVDLDANLSEKETGVPGMKSLSGHADLQVSQDLSSITYAQNGKTERLTPVTPADGATVLYRNTNSSVRAAVIYKDLDLSQVERVYIETSDLLYEVVNCEIGKECYR